MRFFQKTVLSSILGVGARETAAISFLGLLTTSLDPPHNPISSSTDSSKGSLLALEFASASVNRLNMLKKKKKKNQADGAAAGCKGAVVPLLTTWKDSGADWLRRDVPEAVSVVSQPQDHRLQDISRIGKAA